MRIKMSLLPSCCLAVALAAFPLPALTQQPAPAFDEVSIHRTPPGPHSSDLDFNKGMLVGRGIALEFLIENAYAVQDFQLIGLPRTLGDTCFDFTAKVDDASHDPPIVLGDLDAGDRVQQLNRQRLRGLLHDRFALQVHEEKRPGKVYVLTLDKLQPAIHPHVGDDSFVHNRHNADGMQAEAKGVPIASLARMLELSLHAPVEDATHLTGFYDFDLRWSPDPSPDAKSPDLTTALHEQLGLKLSTRKGEVRTVVVDHVELPSSN